MISLIEKIKLTAHRTYSRATTQRRSFDFTDLNNKTHCSQNLFAQRRNDAVLISLIEIIKLSAHYSLNKRFHQLGVGGYGGPDDAGVIKGRSAEDGGAQVIKVMGEFFETETDAASQYDHARG